MLTYTLTYFIVPYLLKPFGPEAFPGCLASVYIHTQYTHIYIYKHTYARVCIRARRTGSQLQQHSGRQLIKKITGTLFFVRIFFFFISYYCEYNIYVEGFEGAPGVVSYF